MKPVIVADRWFGSDKFFSFLEEQSAEFIIRVKGNLRVKLNGQYQRIDQIKDKDVEIEYKGRPLRLVRSSTRHQTALATGDQH